MNNLKPAPMPAYRKWALWIGRIFLVPAFTAVCAGLVFGLYRIIITGQINGPGRNFGPASSTIYLSERPFWFCVLFLLYLALVATFVVLTVVIARLFYRRQPNEKR